MLNQKKKSVVIIDTSSTTKMKLDEKYLNQTEMSVRGRINHKTPSVITASITQQQCGQQTTHTLIFNNQQQQQQQQQKDHQKHFNSKVQNAGATETYGQNLEVSKNKFSPHNQVAIQNGQQPKHPNSLRKLLKKILHISPKKEQHDPKIYEFIKSLDHHKEFFKKSPEIDKYILTLAYIYLKKAFPDQVITNELFFYSLYLAWETEEDSTLGLESIIHYVIGSYPSKNKEKNQRKQEILEWRMRLRQFHAGKDILWKALDYKTVVDYPIVLKTIKTFPNHDILKRDRSTSIKYF
ncbi:hypothetical protein DLAC_07509 [Tieghemostelium lacteum]|uniref:Uncharacterized protein n=1 Tax=Tieghemostelium lacteum TaxID=361077 RepID=A0A151ZCP7_TIELA|nr:hypothetical protein DLAC_07509 [Tieghemostelium lacteum]|eukprot:KYQ91727.1 hypothetical protein DLAC_07509 [Tieghemostelium lacteum]